MPLYRRCLSLLTLSITLSACQSLPDSARNPDAVRLQGILLERDGALFLQPCHEQRLLVVPDESNSLIRQEARELMMDGRKGLFVDLSAVLGATAVKGADGRADLDRLYRIQREGFGCNDLNFKRLIVRAAGHEPGWQVEINSKGLVLRRPEQEPLALPYVEERLPEGSLSFSSAADGRTFELWIAPQRCVDSMSGTVTFLSAQLRLDEEIYQGCAYQGGAMIP